MKKKWKQEKIFLVLMGGLMFGCTGCHTSKPEDIVNTGASLAADVLAETQQDVSGEEVSGADGTVVLSKELRNIPEFSGEIDFTYVYDTDAQSDLGQNSSQVYTKDGCYSMEYAAAMNIDACFLYYTDAASDEKVLVCSKSNCTHRDETCDACFMMEEYPMPILEQYHGALYEVKLDGDYFNIYRISFDGAVRQKSCTLMRLNIEEKVEDDQSVSAFYPELKIHRGYVYFSDYYAGCNTCSLYRVKLDSQEEPEVLFTMTDHSPFLYQIRPYGRYVNFETANADKSGMNFAGGMYTYDTEDGTISHLSDQIIHGYTIQDSFLYYIDMNGGLYRKDLQTGTITPFGEDALEIGQNDDKQLFFHEGHLVVALTDWETRLCTQYVLDEEGRILSTLEGYEYESYIPEGQSKEDVDTLLHPYT